MNMINDRSIKTKATFVLPKYNSTNVKLSFETLAEKIKPEFVEESEFEYRDLSLFRSLLCFLDKQISDARNEKAIVFSLEANGLELRPLRKESSLYLEGNKILNVELHLYG